MSQSKSEQQGRERALERERAEQEVQAHEALLAGLISIHRECAQPWDWQGILTAKPEPPVRSGAREASARRQFERYRAPLLIKWLGGEAFERERLAEAIHVAREMDEEEYRTACERYERRQAAWRRASALAKQVLAGKPKAYGEAIKYANPFLGLKILGHEITCRGLDRSLLEANLYVHSDPPLPQETRQILKSGKLSVKRMPPSRFNLLYRDHVASCLLRVAREILVLLPIETVLVTARRRDRDTASRKQVEVPILSAAVSRANLDLLDQTVTPFEVLSRLPHRIAFTKTKGLAPIEPLAPADI